MGGRHGETAEGEVRKNERMRRKVSVRELQDELEELLTTVVDGDDCVATTRDGRPAAALVPFERHEGLVETVEILSDVDANRCYRDGSSRAASRPDGGPRHASPRTRRAPTRLVLGTANFEEWPLSQWRNCVTASEDPSSSRGGRAAHDHGVRAPGC